MMLKALLMLSSGILAVVGAGIVFTPVAFHASNGIVLGTDASLLSEVRAPGGALLALSALVLMGALRPSWTHTSTLIAAVVFLAYGASRLLGIALDGLPATSLVAACALELSLGLAFLFALTRQRASLGARPRTDASRPRAPAPWRRSR